MLHSLKEFPPCAIKLVEQSKPVYDWAIAVEQPARHLSDWENQAMVPVQNLWVIPEGYTRDPDQPN